MRAHVLQHVHFEGLGNITQWLNTGGYKVTSTQLYQSTQLPTIDDIDLLIIMGGPMSVNDTTLYPWLIDEKKFIRAIIDSGTPTLGICLGAQLIASVMGGNVFPNPEKEIGWFPVTAVQVSDNNAFKFPQETMVFQWHGETFSLPKEAILLAESSTCTNQAFQIGHNVIGLQFHLETTPLLARALVTHCRDELREGTYIQEEGVILSAPKDLYQKVNSLMNDILVYLQQVS